MGKGIIPPLQLYPTENGQLRIEIEHEEDPGHFATVTLTKQHVKYLIEVLEDWYKSTEIKDDLDQINKLIKQGNKS
jgi:hypothetical protein